MRSEPNTQWNRNGDDRDYRDDRADKYSVSLLNMNEENVVDFLPD